MLDLKLTGGTVVDGTGAPVAARPTSAIRDGRIVAIGDVDEQRDAHDRRDRSRRRARLRRPAHALRRAAAVGPDREPVADARRHDRVRRQLRVHARARRPTSTSTTSSRLMARVEGIPLPALQQGLPWDWKTFGDYLERVEDQRHRGERRLPLRALRAAPRRDGRRRGRRRRRPTTQIDADGARCCTTRSTPARWASRRRRRRRTTTATAIRCRRARRRATSCCASPARCAAHPGTQLELIIAGCLNGFTDDDVDLMTAMSLAADRPLNWNVLGVAPGGMHETAARRRARAPPNAGRAGRRAHAAAGHAHPAVVPHRLRARRLPGLARDVRAAGPRAHPRAERSRGAGPPRRAGALAGGRRARRPRALGTARGRRRVHARDAARYEGRKIGDIAKEQGKAPFDALLDIVIADELRTGLAPRLRRARARRDVEDARRRVARPARHHRRLRRGRAPRHDVRRGATRRSSSATRCATATSRSKKPCTCSPTSPRVSTACATAAASPRARYADLVCFDPATVGPTGERTLRRPARRREPHRRRVARRAARARERHRDRPRRRVHRRDARHRAARRARHRHRPRSIHGGLMQCTPTSSDATPSRRVRRHDRARWTCSRPRCADDPHPVYHRGARASARCTRAPGMFGGHGVQPVALRRRAVGAEAPRGVLVEGRREHRQRRAAASRCRSTRPITRKYRRLLDPEFSPTKMAALEPEIAHARQRDHRQVRRPRRVRVPRGLRDAVAVDDLPRADRPARRATCPTSCKWRDDTIRPDADDDGGGRADPRGGRRTRSSEYFETALEEKRQQPRRPAAQHASCTARSTAGR